MKIIIKNQNPKKFYRGRFKNGHQEVYEFNNLDDAKRFKNYKKHE